MFINWLQSMAVCESSEVYHARDLLSCSKIKDFMASPELFHRKHIAKLDPPWSSSSMDLGTTIHEELLLDAMTKGYEIIPAEVLSKSGAKSGNAWKEYKDANRGKILLKLEEAEALDKIVGLVLSHPLAAELLKAEPGDIPELTLLSGVVCGEAEFCIKSRLDKLKGSGVVADIKTIASLDLMKYRPYDHGWDVQSYLYAEAAKLHLELSNVEVRFVVVETKSPYRVRIWAPSAQTMALAEEKVSRALRQIAERTASQNWHSDNWLEIQEF